MNIRANLVQHIPHIFNHTSTLNLAIRGMIKAVEKDFN